MVFKEFYTDTYYKSVIPEYVYAEDKAGITRIGVVKIGEENAPVQWVFHDVTKTENAYKVEAYYDSSTCVTPTKLLQVVQIVDLTENEVLIKQLEVILDRLTKKLDSLNVQTNDTTNKINTVKDKIAKLKDNGHP